jgi:hypothetical protein
MHAMKVFALAMSIGTAALASEALPPRLYELTVETGMPHLEESLRYSTTRQTRCLTREPLSAAFPILSHASLESCRLDQERRRGDTVSYELVCENGRGTTGNAVWQLSEKRIVGTLHVKLGGKNMTFHQRVTATPVGRCEA